MKLMVTVKLDVTKIDKSRIFEGKKGKYLDLITFIDTEKEDQYGNHGFISQSVSKEEREAGVRTPILGNVKARELTRGGGSGASQGGESFQQPSTDDFDDQIPF